MRPRIKKHLFPIVIFLLTVLSVATSRSAGANTGLDGFNVFTLHFPSDASGVLSLVGTQTLGSAKFAAGLALHGFGRMVDASNPVNNQRSKIVNNVAMADFSAAIGLGDYVNIGFILPVDFYVDGVNVNTQNNYSKAVLGDLAIDAKVRVLKDKAKSVGLGFLSRLYLPTGNTECFTGWDKPAWEARFIADKTFGPFYLNANIGYRVVAKTNVRNRASGVVWNVSDDDRIVFGLGGSYALPLQKRSWEIMVAISGESVVSDFKKISTPVIVDAGIKKNFQNGLSVQFGGGRGLIDAIGSPSYHVFAALSFDGGRRHRAKLRAERAKQITARLRETILFGFDSASISREAQQAIGDVAEFMEENYDTNASVDGYTDSAGPSTYNYELGVRRAKNVAEELRSRGVKDERLTVESHGENDPAGDNMSREGRRRNRRVEIDVN